MLKPLRFHWKGRPATLARFGMTWRPQNLSKRDGFVQPMAAKRPPPKAPRAHAKAPRSHIVREEKEDVFLKEVADFFEKGYRPIQDMKTFAAYDRRKGEWKTLYIMPLVHFEELKAFQTVPTSEEEEQEERMFG